MDICEQLPARTQEEIDVAPFNTWTSPDQTTWTEFYRTHDGYLLRFPNLADFKLSAEDSRVRCIPAPGTDKVTCDHIYLSEILPLLHGKQGKLVFHASAIELENHAIAFLGDSGRGKSTMAAMFSVRGYRFLTDDSLILEPTKLAYKVLPSQASIRLWSDSENAVLSPNSSKAPSVSFTSKSRFLADGNIRFCEQPRDLKRVYFLGDGNIDRLNIKAVSTADALLGLVKQSFILDVDKKSTLADHFDQVTSLAKQPIHYHLDFPRRYGELDGVIEAILEHERSTA